MRTIEEIMADPVASTEEIAWVANQNGRSNLEGEVLALSHPNCPIGLWWSLAKDHPIAAIESSVYPLIMLESPSQWAELEMNLGDAWIQGEWRQLPKAQQERFVLDCIARMRPYFEDLCPGDSTFDDVFSLRQQYVNGEIGLGEFEHQTKDARRREERLSKSDDQEEQAVSRILWALTLPDMSSAPYRSASYAITFAVMGSWDSANETWTVPDTRPEDQWQWRRFLQYLRNEA